MIIISDSSPLVVLVNLGRTDLLPTLFGRVLIPPEVHTELSSPKRPEAVRAFAANPPKWLEVRAATAVEEIPGLQPGEAAAISLAQELNADRIIIDEAKGRKEAAGRNLRVVGTLGVLEIAAERGLVDLAQVFAELKETDFWVSAKLLDTRLALFLDRERRRAEEAGRQGRERAGEPADHAAPEPVKDPKPGE